MGIKKPNGHIFFKLAHLDDDEPEVTKVTQTHKSTLERWQESCLLSTSLSQVFLHLSTLEKAITWAKSVLHTRCKLCRRKGDPEKMLLCDTCDRGHHMYCLKPPLKVTVGKAYTCTSKCFKVCCYCPENRTRWLPKETLPKDAGMAFETMQTEW